MKWAFGGEYLYSTYHLEERYFRPFFEKHKYLFFICIYQLLFVTFSILLKTLHVKCYGMTAPETQRDNQSDFEVVVSSSDWISESGMSEDTPLFANDEDKRPVVKDGYRKVWIVFYMLGMATLLPWNFFIAVNDYWNYKFRDVDNATAIFNPPSTSNHT